MVVVPSANTTKTRQSARDTLDKGRGDRRAAGWQGTEDPAREGA